MLKIQLLGLIDDSEKYDSASFDPFGRESRYFRCHSFINFGVLLVCDM
jgi:hypothetical protein